MDRESNKRTCDILKTCGLNKNNIIKVLVKKWR